MTKRKVLVVACVLLAVVSIILMIAVNRSGKQEIVQTIPDTTTQIATDDTTENADEISSTLEDNQITGIESLELVASCYDTSDVSDVRYTGVPQVDNCIKTLLGSGEYKPMEDTNTTIDSVPVHLYILDVNDSVFAIVYYPNVEAIALPLGVTPAEYYAGNASLDFGTESSEE